MITPRPDEQGTCDRCLADVLWVHTVPNNAKRPIDPEPNADGSTAVYRDQAGRLRARQLTKERPAAEGSEVIYMTHHATCARPRPRRTSRPNPPPRTQRRHWGTATPGWHP
ncbi:hypothetical protein [Streptomyces sp. NBC_01262]|uniref:hypothetical protein n=1 Tax=Streptomyces sp. NBC_01262 TaxID=2903803 RepID=UPI002E33E34C|nr:hypothetical protein [Streptomyces sp. NBC_01262]